MLEPRRLAAIMRLVKDRGVVPVSDLIAATGASPATLRRDLTKLARMGEVRRVHGGVEALGFADRPSLATRHFDIARTLHAGRKRAIARAAVGLVADGESIIVNAGTTTFAMVEFLRDRRLLVVTNSFPMAQALVATTRNRVILPGGEVWREQGIVLSPFDGDALQHVAGSKMFMGAVAVTPLGVIEGDPLIARAEAKLLGRAADLILLVDSSKFAPRGGMAVCPLSRVRTVITDDGVPEAAVAMLRGAGIEVMIAPPAEEERRDTSAA